MEMVIAGVSYNAMVPRGINSLGLQGRDRPMGKLFAAQNGEIALTGATIRSFD
jgi:hypothetical protein